MKNHDENEHLDNEPRENDRLPQGDVPLDPRGRPLSAPEDDPRVSAFALGELEGEELVRFRAELEANPALVAEVEAFRKVSEVLESEFSLAPTTSDALTRWQREEVERASTPQPGPRTRRVVRRVAVGLLAASVIGAGILVWKLRDREPLVRTASGGPYAYDLGLPAQPRDSEDSRVVDSLASASPASQPERPILNLPKDGAIIMRKSVDDAETFDQDMTVLEAELGALAAQTELAQKVEDLALGLRVTPPGSQESLVGVVSTGSTDTYPYRGPGDSVPPTSTARLAAGQATSSSDGFFLGTSPTNAPPAPAVVESRRSSLNFDLGEPLDADKRALLERIRDHVESRDDLESLSTHRDLAHDNESYARILENEFRRVTDEPLSTFSIDVDTASYANMRRYLTAGQLPPPDAVRVEELLNYFDYQYGDPDGTTPFATHATVTACPWQPDHRLLRIGLQGRRPENRRMPTRNLVFLVDVSGSMNAADKLPLLKSSLKLLVEQLGEEDTVAIVTYAGASGLALPATNGLDKPRLHGAIERMQPGGSTAGAAGIQLAYQIALENFQEGGVNRVILATDGDFNVGISDDGALTSLIEEKRTSGVFLSVLGFGTGNLKDSKMEALADHGNGNYSYIDSLTEARKVLVHELGATLDVIAKDVKIQVEFNPLVVRGYRLIGYENRALAARDFNDDTKDAGEIGAGHTVTALYELVPTSLELDAPGVDALRYQERPEREVQPSSAALSGELATVKLRYKRPDEDVSSKLEIPVRDGDLAFSKAPEDLRFATAVAMFGMKLRGSIHTRHVELGAIRELAEGALGTDRFGYRSEFLRLVDRATTLIR